MNTANILRWFTGKRRDNAEHALKLLDEAVKLGEWPPKYSRPVRAALTKHNVAEKLSREIAEQQGRDKFFAIEIALTYGGAHIRRADEFCRSDVRADTLPQINRVAEFILDMLPVIEAMDKLDAAIPRPRVSLGEVSPTLQKTLGEAGLDLDAKTVRFPEIKWELVTVQKFDAKSGKMVEAREWVGKILWPNGTRHSRSRFCGYTGRARYQQCEACGHGLPKGSPVPILVDDASGTPYSLWVGRDCARTLFGVKISGEGRFDK